MPTACTVIVPLSTPLTVVPPLAVTVYSRASAIAFHRNLIGQIIAGDNQLVVDHLHGHTAQLTHSGQTY